MAVRKSDLPLVESTSPEFEKYCNYEGAGEVLGGSRFLYNRWAEGGLPCVSGRWSRMLPTYVARDETGRLLLLKSDLLTWKEENINLIRTPDRAGRVCRVWNANGKIISTRKKK